MVATLNILNSPRMTLRPVSSRPFQALVGRRGAGVSPYYPRLAPAIAANGLVQFSVNPTAGQTLTINGTAITFVASGATGNQVNIGASLYATTDSLLAFLRSSSDANISAASYNLRHGGSVGQTSTSTFLAAIFISHNTPGAAGNAFTLATTTTAGLSGATLTGGADNKSLTWSVSKTNNPLASGRSLYHFTNPFATELGAWRYDPTQNPPYQIVSTPTGFVAPLVKTAFVHVGNRLVAQILGSTGSENYYQVKVDDQYISPVSLRAPYETQLAQVFYLDLPFDSVDERRIEFIMGGGTDGCVLNTIYIGQTDEVYPAPIRGPKTAILGTSQLEGTTNGQKGLGSYGVFFADAMGWDDVAMLGRGGTGILNTNNGTDYTYIQRINDLHPNTRLVMVETGYGHTGTAQQCADGASALIDAIRVRCVNAEIVFFDLWSQGVETMQLVYFQRLAAMQAVCAAKGVQFVTTTELPVDEGFAPQTSTLAASAAAGDSTISVTSNVTLDATFKFADGTKGYTRSRSGSGPYTITLGGPLATAHSAGETITTCGRSVDTGNGKVGSTIGWGSADLNVGSDGVHRTFVGARATGYALAGLVQGLYAG